MPTKSALTVAQLDPLHSAPKMLSRSDARIFGAKLTLVCVVVAISVWWVLSHGVLASLPAQAVLGVMFAHAVELQHQALHGTGLRSARRSRVAGVLLGLPMLVSYSRYRALHLLHHRYLGTDRDTEFFAYSSSDQLTFRTLLTSAFNVRRWLSAARDMIMSLNPRTCYERVIAQPVHRRVRTEYRLMLGMLVALAALSLVVGEPLIISLWLVPLPYRGADPLPRGASGARVL